MKKIEDIQTHLGTPIKIEVVAYDEGKAQRAIQRAFAEAARIEAAYSRFIENNALSALNANIGEWVDVSEELYALIAFGIRVGERSHGAFNLTVKSILEGWGYDANYSLTEGASSGQVGTLECHEGRVRATASVDLGGLGKGYAIDRMVNELTDFSNIMVNAGGDLFARGQDLKGPWKVALEHPTNAHQAIGIIEVDNFAVGASSPLRRQWRDRHHLVDPHAGEPAHEMLAVFTQAPAALLADAYSTALFSLGFEKAAQLIPDLPIEALLMGPDGRGWMSEGFRGELF